MPHRNMEDVKELEKSLNLVSNKKNIILTGDFNCPDINWDTMTVNQDAQDKEIQRAVMEVVTANSMVQIHEQPTRGNNLLDIVLTIQIQMQSCYVRKDIFITLTVGYPS